MNNMRRLKILLGIRLKWDGNDNAVPDLHTESLNAPLFPACVIDLLL